MKKLIKFLILSVCTIFLSCVSQPANKEVAEVEPEKNEEVPVAVEPAIAEKVLTEEEKFLEVFENISISVVSCPKETSAGKTLDAPYVVKCDTKTGEIPSSIKICVSYPASKTAGKINFDTAIVSVDSEGKAVFDCPTPNQPIFSELKFYPYWENATDEIKKIQEEKSVRSPIRIKTSRFVSGGAIAIVDFNSQGKPITTNSVTSSNLLMCMMNSGFKNIGNADLTSQIVSGNEASILKEATDFFGNSVSYLIYGTVKYISPVAKNGDVFECTIKGEITCVDMKTKTILSKIQKEVTSASKAEWETLPQARKSLAYELCDEIIYGL